MIRKDFLRMSVHVDAMVTALDVVGDSDNIDEQLAGSIISCVRAARRADLNAFNQRMCSLVSYGDRMPPELKTAVDTYVAAL